LNSCNTILFSEVVFYNDVIGRILVTWNSNYYLSIKTFLSKKLLYLSPE